MKKNTELELEAVDMYVLFAKMFAHITREVENTCGEKGIQAVREGVRKFGEERGAYIAKRAKEQGHEAVLDYYLSCYDMERSQQFESDDKITEKGVEQLFTKCVFAEQWMKDGNQKYGIHYCEMIDPAIVKGYGSEYECIHDKHFFKDGCCHFIFHEKK